jgi:uncharacterized protein
MKFIFGLINTVQYFQMKKIFVVSILCMSLVAKSQKIYFPKSAYSDSISIKQNMPILAKNVLKSYKEAEQDSYLDNVFRFQIVAEQYAESIKNLHDLREILKKTDSERVSAIGAQFELFSKIKIAQNQSKETFENLFTPNFFKIYQSFPKEAKILFEAYFGTDLKTLQTNFKNILVEIDSDSISSKTAQRLCRAYSSYMVYNQILSLGKPILVREEQRQYIIEDSVLIKTRDGASISAIVVRNREQKGKLPTILEFNIYNSSRDRDEVKKSASNGYVGVVANTRGKKYSPQEIEPFEHDANDAYDIIEWISKQSWSDGQVGMHGGSYLGFAQWAAVKHLHPALKTIVPQVSVGIGIDYPMENNVFMSYMLRWIHYVCNSKETDTADFTNEEHWNSVFRKWYSEGKAFQSLDTLENRPNKIFQRWLQHPSHDAYWQNMVAFKTDFAKIKIPVLTTTGYYDDDQMGARYYFDQHHLYNKSANHYFLIGPYDHGGAQGHPSPAMRGYTIDSVANINISNLVIEWFDYILKKKAKPAILKDKINYQVMGTNIWKHAPSLRQMNNDTLNLYLTNVKDGTFFQLSSQKTVNNTFVRQKIDLTSRADSMQTIPGEEPILSDSIDVPNTIPFISNRFDKAFDINGAFLGNISVSINKKDMDLLINLYELTPDNKYHWLGRYLTRASYSKNRSKRQLLQPNQIESIPINNAYFTSKKISKGSRLVVSVGANKSPHWEVNYGTGNDVSTETIKDAKIPLEIKWHSNSQIKIPIYK